MQPENKHIKYYIYILYYIYRILCVTYEVFDLLISKGIINSNLLLSWSLNSVFNMGATEERRWIAR